MLDDLGAVLNGTREYPDEDSEDLTDEEIAKAISTDNESGIVNTLSALRCGDCGGNVRIVLHELRRRRPHMYWRTTVECDGTHKTSRLFVTDWL